MRGVSGGRDGLALVFLLWSATGSLCGGYLRVSAIRGGSTECQLEAVAPYTPPSLLSSEVGDKVTSQAAPGLIPIAWSCYRDQMTCVFAGSGSVLCVL